MFCSFSESGSSSTMAVQAARSLFPDPKNNFKALRTWWTSWFSSWKSGSTWEIQGFTESENNLHTVVVESTTPLYWWIPASCNPFAFRAVPPKSIGSFVKVAIWGCVPCSTYPKIHSNVCVYTHVYVYTYVNIYIYTYSYIHVYK